MDQSARKEVTMTDSTTPNTTPEVAHIPTDEMTDNNCPKCGSSEITGGFVETGDGIAVQKVSCDVCDAVWRNIYDFAAVELLDEDVVIEITR
jgi:formate dehydrogenase maturation protein FdhE